MLGGSTPSREEPTWFGSLEVPLYGWLTLPRDSNARGGVVLTSPLGREARASRRALRDLAAALAERGFVVLRYDYPGTGDSTGVFDDASGGLTLVDSVRVAVDYLRASGLETVSAVGMRLGGTVLGVAASWGGLQLTDLVLWDACESGRSYLRELSALEALRRADFEFESDGTIETSEFVFAPHEADHLRELSLVKCGTHSLAERVLAITRDDRVVSQKLRSRLDRENITWIETNEQVALLNVEPLSAKMPAVATATIVQWLDQTSSRFTPYVIERRTDIVAASTDGRPLATERFISIGDRDLFGVVTEPAGAAAGPWLIFINVANEDHTGPARLWVELARRWAAQGLRSLRFDLSGLGDSPTMTLAHRPVYERQWPVDVISAVRAVSPDDPSSVVLLGLCSGAFHAVEGALALHVRAVCVINPPVGIDFFHFISRMDRTSSRVARWCAARCKKVALHIPWVGVLLWHVFKHLVPRSIAPDVMATAAANGTELFVLASEEELSPYRNVPLLRSVDRGRLLAPKNYTVDFVPGLDHAMHTALGRELTVALLDQHVTTHYARSTTTSKESNDEGEATT